MEFIDEAGAGRWAHKDRSGRMVNAFGLSLNVFDIYSFFLTVFQPRLMWNENVYIWKYFRPVFDWKTWFSRHISESRGSIRFKQGTRMSIISGNFFK